MLLPTLKKLSVSSLNRVTLVGALHDVQTGFVDKCSVFQFVVTCSVLDLHKADGDSVTKAEAATLARPMTRVSGGGGEAKGAADFLSGSGPQLSKEQYTVRCLGDEAYTEMLKSLLEDGSIVRVVGRLKTIEALDGTRKQLFPCIFVEQGRWSHVSLLHSYRKQRRDWQLQNILSEMREPKQPTGTASLPKPV